MHTPQHSTHRLVADPDKNPRKFRKLLSKKKKTLFEMHRACASYEHMRELRTRLIEIRQRLQDLSLTPLSTHSNPVSTNHEEQHQLDPESIYVAIIAAIHDIRESIKEQHELYVELYTQAEYEDAWETWMDEEGYDNEKPKVYRHSSASTYHYEYNPEAGYLAHHYFRFVDPT